MNSNKLIPKSIRQLIERSRKQSKKYDRFLDLRLRNRGKGIGSTARQKHKRGLILMKTLKRRTG